MTRGAPLALLPYKFARAGNHALVFLVDPDRVDWRNGFFNLALPKGRPFERIIPFDEWSAEGEAACPVYDFRKTGAIFHVSRCGSTLLAQNLKASGALVLGEPPFMRILRDGIAGSVDRERSLGAVALAVAQWQAWAVLQGRPLIVKFNSQAHRYRESLMHALPNARFLFLHREPLPVLESLSRKPPRHLRAERPGQPCSALTGLAEDPVLLAGAAGYLASLDAFEGVAGERLMTAGYDELPLSFAQIATHLGCENGAERSWNAAPDAKTIETASPPPYRPVAPETLAAFERTHRPLLELMDGRYRSFVARAPRRRECPVDLTTRRP